MNYSILRFASLSKVNWSPRSSVYSYLIVTKEVLFSVRQAFSYGTSKTTYASNIKFTINLQVDEKARKLTSVECSGNRAQNAPELILESLNFKIFPGGHAPDPLPSPHPPSKKARRLGMHFAHTFCMFSRPKSRPAPLLRNIFLRCCSRRHNVYYVPLIWTAVMTLRNADCGKPYIH